MEPVKEYTNVTFDEIQIGASAEIAVTLTQNQIDLAAMVSGDVDAFYLMQPGDADKRQEAKKTEAAGAEAIISIVLGTRLPGPGTKILHRDLRFAGDFSVGDTLTAKVTAREKRKEGNLVVFDARRSCEVRLARQTAPRTGTRLVTIETLDRLAGRRAEPAS